MDRESTKLYGECAYLLDKILDKCESMDGGWDELINYLAAIDDRFDTEKDFYYKYYKFIRQVYWRIKPWNEKQPFNQVQRKEVPIKHDGKLVHVDGFSIWNYDYKMYMWAINRGFTYGMNPSMIDVAAEELTPAELKRFEKKAEENK